jgi:hypothetical protein
MRNRKSPFGLLKQYFDFGLGLLLTTAVAALKIPAFGDLFKTDTVHAVSAIILFLVTCLWIGGWIYFDHNELQLLEDYFKDVQIRRIKITPYLSMIFIGVLSGLLLGLSDKLQFYILVAIVNWVVSSFGDRQAQKNFEQIYKNFSEFRSGPRKLICEYYMKRPFFLLGIITFAFLAIALALAWYAVLRNEPFILTFSYVLTILTVLIHEVILWEWRINRDRSIDAYEEKALSRAVKAGKGHSAGKAS